MSETRIRTAVPRALLPGALAAAYAGAPAGQGPGRERRTPRDWAVDVALFLWAVMWWAIMLSALQDHAYLPDWMRTVDAPLGAAACLSLWWRRRFPLAVALFSVPVAAVANSSVGALMVVVLNLAMRVPWQRAVPVLVVYLVTAMPYVLLYSVPHEGGWVTAAFVFAYYLVFFAWGTAIRARRQLILRMREDADRERREHSRHLADTRRAERTAIAREMHDVLAHRISLLSVHAGALAYRTKQSAAGRAPALADTEVSESAQVIRDNAHLALEELREVLHVLRADSDERATSPAGADGTAEATGSARAGSETGEHAGSAGGGMAPPQPSMADIPRLVDEARQAGQQVGLDDGIIEQAADSLRCQVQRTAYRVVQEGLTNARKHAPGARVGVRLAGAPGTGLTVEVHNPLPVGVTASEIPGAGAGLTGLRERVDLDGGTLEHGSGDGTFTLTARLPWPHDSRAARR
ncbi:histidine kinase [Streptomyces sp. 549]|uniref:sensor histidine kinase n=1 Tax=Streptomyces sp. 549 TaxID=3049076 RepID=UPI0024C430A2|nr:histidine kinase [Streptomyces sp. 549]MDK1472427.1 histidine kinase [Streptomyces sp. 549]